MLLELIRRCSVRADETVMVGDMETDVESARAAGVRAVLLTVSGFHRPAELLAAADDVAASVTELSELLR
jgi:phosphoglycolate phosphatase-like HAD superfamily hydrolase